MSVRRVGAVVTAALAITIGTATIAACEDDAPSGPTPEGTKPLEPGPASSAPIVNQNPSNPINNTPGAGSG